METSWTLGIALRQTPNDFTRQLETYRQERVKFSGILLLLFISYSH